MQSNWLLTLNGLLLKQLKNLVLQKLLYTWVDKYSRPKEPMMRTDEHLYDELKKLKKELTIVTHERDLLKKAAVYFANESR